MEHDDRVRRAGRVLAVTGGAATAAAVLLARAGVEPFPSWLYQTGWYGLLAAAAGALAWRDGRVPVGPGQALSLFLWSVPVWYLFEAANLRLANWYYVLLPPEASVRWIGSAVAFATVLPALHLAHRWWKRAGLARGWRTSGFRLGSRGLAGVAVAGVAFAALALWRPGTFYPLIWGALTLLLEPWNHRRDPAGSLLADLERGRPGRVVRLLAAGLAVGVAWESLNAVAAARWIYTVPGLERLKLFEMPLPGYLGFPVLALDGFVAYRALAAAGVAVPAWREDDPGEREAARDGSAGERGIGPEGGREPIPPGGPRFRPRRALAAGLAAAALCAAVQIGVDRWTVDSHRRPLERLPGVGPSEAEALRAAGAGDVAALAGADSTRLAASVDLSPAETGAAVRAARLARVRGMGTRNTRALWAADIRSVCELAEAGQREVARAVRRRRADPRAGHPPRVRVWLAEARRGCPCGCG